MEPSRSSAHSIAACIDRLRVDRNFLEAEVIGREALANGITDAAVQIALGRLELSRSCYDDALGYFENAIRCDPSSGVAVAWQIATLCRLKYFNEAEKVGLVALLKFPLQIAVLITVGRLHLDRYRREKSIKEFDKALEVDPLNSTALRWRVSALRELRRFGEAESAARSAIGACPHEPLLLAQLGRVYDDQGKYEEALEWFGKALEVDPLNSTALR